MKKGKHKHTLDDFLPIDDIRKKKEEERIAYNIATIDEELADLAEYIGRDLTEFEESAILDIVDEYTPKYENGNYMVDLLPMDYAWEIYEVKRAYMFDKLSQE